MIPESSVSANEAPATGTPDDVPAGRAHNHRYTHAKNDPATCTVPGLFQPLKRGERKGKNHFVTHQYGDVSLEFLCFEPLGADDLRVLQGLLAIGSPISTPVILNSESDGEHRVIRENLKLNDASHKLETLVVQGSAYQLAKEIGFRTDGAATFLRVRACIERLCRVSVLAKYKDGRHHGYQLIGGYSSELRKKEIHVVLNPRLTAAVLGKRIDATGSHTRIEMEEVRRIQGDTTRILHSYLCAIIAPGETRELLASTMRAHVWHQVNEAKNKATDASRAKYLARAKKQHQRLGQSLDELNGLGWKCALVTKTRTNSQQEHYIKYQISRPGILETTVREIGREHVPGNDRISMTRVPETPGVTSPNSPAVENPSENPTGILKTESLKKENLLDLANLVRHTPAKALRDYGQQLDDDQFAIASKKQPIAAIKHCLDRLTDEQFTTAANRVPGEAMRYALDRLTDVQFEKAAKKAPSAAIKFALARLTPDQFIAAAVKTEKWPVGNPEVSDAQLDAWFSADPHSAISHSITITEKNLNSFQDLIQHLTPARLASCARKWPKEAFEYARLIPADILIEIARGNPALAIQQASAGDAGKYIPQETLDVCILLAPGAAITHRLHLLTPEQRVWCLKKSPWTATKDFNALTIDEREICRQALEKAIPAKLEQIIEEAPAVAMQYANKYLNSSQLNRCLTWR